MLSEQTVDIYVGHSRPPQMWYNIDIAIGKSCRTESKESLPNANEHENESDKFKKYFSENIK